LIGRADAVVHQLELSSRSGRRFAQFAHGAAVGNRSSRIRPVPSARFTQLAANTTEALGKSAAASMAATETLNRSAAEANGRA